MSFRRSSLFTILSISFVVSSCATPQSHKTSQMSQVGKGTERAPAAAKRDDPRELDRQIQVFLEKSLPRMACNISVGHPGSIIASPENQDPNYYFHWIRDSALIVESLSRLLTVVRGTDNEAQVRGIILDFAAFSEKLQKTPSSHGAGETRFNVDGTVDTTDWPRPQYDGPALRALALMRYLSHDRAVLSPSARAQVEGVIRTDLDSVARHYREQGFDLYEFAKGHHFFTRLVQLGALQRGLVMFKNDAKKEWRTAADELLKAATMHWSDETSVISAVGPSIDLYGNPVPIDRSAYDSSTSLAVLHADLAPGAFDVLDERVWITLWRQKSYFLKEYPMNQVRDLGPAIGRNPGDDYYGGNAWFFLTAAFSEVSFRMADAVRSRKTELVANDRRLMTLQHALRRPVTEKERFKLPNADLAAAFAREGAAYLKTMLDVIPADGAIAEQFSKVDGAPVSARDLTWSYASIMTAILQRESFERSSVDYSRFKFSCPLK